MKKLYYTIGEVSEIVNEEKYVLRYWENEFALLHPKKNSAGNRSYTEHDICVIRKIQELLRNQQMRLKDAKDILPTMKIEDDDDKSISQNNPQPKITFVEKGEIELSQDRINIDDFTKQEVLTLLKDIRTYIELEY